MNNANIPNGFKKLNNNSSSENNISPDMVNNLMNMFNNYTNKNSQTSSNTNVASNTTTNSSNSNGIDFETIMKMKSIIDKMNIKDDPRSNLLQSLKPYLKDSRKSKVDQYIQLMNMSKVLDVFPFIGGDKSK